MKQLPFLLERPEDRDIQGCWHLPETNTVGTILFLHGYKGYMAVSYTHLTLPTNREV